MRTIALTLALTGIAVSLGGCTQYGDAYGSSYASGFGPPPNAPFYADHYYRADPRYHERKLRRDEVIHVGTDGHYYCRRRDGTTGLVSGIKPGALDGLVPPGGSMPLRQLLDSPASAAIDVKHLRCR